MQTLCAESGLRTTPNWPKIRKMAMTSQFPDMTSSSRFFDVVLFLLWSSYWSKCNINIITGSGIMPIFFYKGLTRNPEIGNTLVWVLSNIWRLKKVMGTTFDKNVSNRMLLNAAKFQGYSFYCSWVIKGNQLGGGVKLPSPPPLLIQIWVKGIRMRYAAPITLLSIFRGTVRMD